MTCKLCRQPIPKTKIYCSIECRKTASKIRQKELRAAKKEERLAKASIKSISEINRLALDMGMSYGEYVLRTEVLK